jgi:hypothetical protein
MSKAQGGFARVPTWNGKTKMPSLQRNNGKASLSGYTRLAQSQCNQPA